MIFLDSAPIIYLIEQPPVLGARSQSRIATLQAAGLQLVVSDLVRFECLVGPLKSGNAAMETKFRTFFSSPDVQVVPVSPAIADLAASIRAKFGLKSLDSLHLAAAVDHGCTMFLTNDRRLSRFTGIAVEVL